MFAYFIPAMALLAAAVQPVPSIPTPPAASAWVFPVEFKIEPLPVRGHWTAKSDNDVCGLAAWSKTADGTIGLWAVHPPASNDYVLTVVQPAKLPVSAEPLRPRLRINAPALDHPIEMDAFARLYSQQSLEARTMKLEREQLKALLSSRIFTIDVDAEPRVQIELDGGGTLMPLEECERDGLKAAGLDPDLPAKLSKWPSFGTAPYALFSDDDYPASVMAAGVQGTVQVRLNVDSTGRAQSCVVVTSSGSPILDAKTCEIYLRRAKMTPALDRNGKPVAAPALAKVTWRLSS